VRDLMEEKRSSILAGRAGFTVPGILVGLGLGLVTAAAFGSLHHLQLRTFKTEANKIDLQTAARNIIDLMTAEIRQAGLDPTCGGNIQAIIDAKQFRLRIQADHDGRGLPLSEDEDVTYEFKFSNQRFDRIANGVTDPLITGIDLTGSRVRYFNGAGTEITAGSTGLSSSQRGNVRRIRIELVLQQAAGTGGNTHPLKVAVASDIDLRNRYFAATASGCS
jgi:hypothetical protein